MKKDNHRGDFLEYIKVKGVKIGEGTPKIAVSICGKTSREVIEKAKNLDLKKVDIVEWRVDYFEDIFNIKNVLETLKELKSIILNKPIIFTFRSKDEGGEKDIPIEHYLDLNMQVAKSRDVDIVDIEISIGETLGKALIKEIQKSGVYAITSSHNFSETPDKKNMIQILKRMDEIGGDILKLAVMPRTKEDVIDLLLITNEMKKDFKNPIVTISMGDLGNISRISGELFGSSISFASGGGPSAPGQIGVEELYNILRLCSKSSFN